LSAIGGAKDSALGVGPVGMAKHGDEDTLGVTGIDDDSRNLLAIAQAHVFPDLAAIGGFVDAVANRQVRPLQALAAAYVDDVGIRGSDCHGPDRAGGLIIEDRVPGA